MKAVLAKQKLHRNVIQLTKRFQNAIGTEDKEYIRSINKKAKFSVDQRSLELAKNLYFQYQENFIEPSKLDINRISPCLINVDEDKSWSDIFKLIRHTWSMPYSKGFGRRLRYIVFDEYHEAVIGVIGLQSPPADLACRDVLFDYPEDKKLDLVNQTMDIYTLGAVPPYSGLLGGKLVAGLAASTQIRKDFLRKYRNRKTLINRKIISNNLVALTTTSAFGRSSIYNRLKYKNHLLAQPIGYTKGYGNVHLEPIYGDIEKLLDAHNKLHNGGYGKGPKQRWQNLIRAFQLLDLPETYLKHGLKRQVFLFRLCEYLEKGMSGGRFGKLLTIDPTEYSYYWLERWAKPRAERMPQWMDVDIKKYFQYCLKN